MTISERILLSFSKAPGGESYPLKDSEVNIATALDLLHRAYPNLREFVAGKRVVDFGCGAGYQSIALAKEYGCSVVGVDSNQRTLNQAIENARKINIPSGQLSFVENIPKDMLESFDVVISQNSFEHFTNPERVLKEMGGLLKNSGIILITFGPPWLAPYGSHMQFFCRFPWINVLFSENTVMKVRSRFRSDGAKKYDEVESGLNKMTIARFESIVTSSNLSLTYRRYECIKGVNWLSKLPVVRELFINHVTAVLSKAN